MKKEDSNTHYLPLCMCLGISIGTAIGSATGNLSVYMPIGVAIGVGIGAILDAKNRKTSEDTEQPDDTDTL